MSYTLLTVFTQKAPASKVLPVKDLKVGDKVYAYADRQEGDGGDFHGFLMLTIKSIDVVGATKDFTCLEFDGIHSDDDVIVATSSYIEISGKVTVRDFE